MERTGRVEPGDWETSGEPVCKLGCLAARTGAHPEAEGTHELMNDNVKARVSGN